MCLDKDKEVVKFAEKIGVVRQTNFGKYFDVLAKVEPNSNAYTSLKLYPHTDLPHHEVAPAYQLFHFLNNDAEGGFSTLVDGFQVCKVLKRKDPKAYELLTKPIYTFRFQDNNSEHSFKGSVIELDKLGNPNKIRMNLNVMAPLIAPVNDVRNARQALITFFNLIVSDKFQFSCKLEAGDLMINANHRILHGRTAFEMTSGTRHLQGCYLDQGEVISCIQVLQRKLIGNTDGISGQVFDDSGHFLISVNA